MRVKDMKPDLHKVYIQIGRRIKQEREALGMSREDLSKESGYSYPMVTSFENGSTRLNIDNIVLVARALGVSVHALIP